MASNIFLSFLFLLDNKIFVAIKSNFRFENIKSFSTFPNMISSVTSFDLKYFIIFPTCATLYFIAFLWFFISFSTLSNKYTGNNSYPDSAHLFKNIKGNFPLPAIKPIFFIISLFLFYFFLWTLSFL